MKMTAEFPTQPEFPEVDSMPKTSYERSAELLFGMLDNIPPEDETPYYYKVEWDAAETTRITDIYRTTIEPSGARRQEMFGEFYQAQFYCNEVSLDGTEQERFIWCDTDPERSDDPVSLNAASLQNRHGYQELGVDTVATTLIDRVNSVEDCISLLRLMSGRETHVDEQLSRRVNRYMTKLIYGGLMRSDASVSMPVAEQMFELIEQCQDLGRDVPRLAQGSLVSHLLRSVSGQKALNNAKTLDPETAVSVLVMALNRNVITSPKIIGRVLTCNALYKYPFVTEIMHAQLQDKANNRGPVNVFGVERIGLASRYIVTRLRDGETSLPATVKEYLDGVDLRSFDHSNRHARPRLFELMQYLVEHIGNDESMAPPTNTLLGVASSFEYILNELHEDYDEEQWAFDVKSSEVVGAILGPAIRASIGKTALLDRDELDD